MARWGRAILAVIAGAAVWAVLWISGMKALGAAFPSLLQVGQPVTHSGVLLSLIGYSVLLSILAGYITAAVAGQRPRPAIWSLAILQLAFGIIAETSAWNLMPAWYHLVFLALIVPATIWGGTWRTARAKALSFP
jgi:hypothetical protein